MHARRTGWQRLAAIVTTLSCLLLSGVVAAADSAPAPRRHAPISPVPDIPGAVTRGGVGTSGSGGSAPPDRIATVRSTLNDPLNDVTSIPVPVTSTAVTVAYTVEHGPDGDAEIVTTRVPDADAAVALVEELEERPRVAAAEIDTVFAALADTTTARRAVSDPERGRQWGLDLLDAERVWSQGNACGQTIAVVDSGVDGEHPDLRGIVLRGKNMVSRGIGAVDRSGHGTEVAGVAAGAHDNARGISGLAPGARVLPVGIEDAAGQMHASDLAAAIRYAIDRDATVINLSLGGPVRSSNVDYWLDRAHEAGIPVVASAGNARNNDNPRIWPAASPTTIAVGAVAPTGVWAPFSSTGRYVDLAAPGVAVLTTGRDGSYVAGNGTSLAAPFVSATVAMLQAADDSLTPDDVRALLVDNATDAGPPGRDARFGHGIVDPLASLRAVGGPALPCFTDVADLTLADEIERLGLAGVTDGCAVRRFCPAQAVTRGQMATFLSRVVPQPATDADFFDDDASSPHQDGINRLAQADIANGCSTASFCPNASVTRGQMAAFIARALDLPAASVDAFSDDGRSLHEGSINALAAVNITGGCDAGRPQRFCPDATVTRAQMAAFLVRMMDHGR